MSRKEIEQTVAGLLEQESDLSQLDLGPEPELTPEYIWTAYVVRKTGNDDYPEDGSRHWGSLAEIVRWLGRYHNATESAVIELVRELRRTLPMTYGVHVVSAQTFGDIYTYALAQGDVSFENMQNAILEYEG